MSDSEADSPDWVSDLDEDPPAVSTSVYNRHGAPEFASTSAQPFTGQSGQVAAAALPAQAPRLAGVPQLAQAQLGPVAAPSLSRLVGAGPLQPPSLACIRPPAVPRPQLPLKPPPLPGLGAIPPVQPPAGGPVSFLVRPRGPIAMAPVANIPATAVPRPPSMLGGARFSHEVALPAAARSSGSASLHRQRTSASPSMTQSNMQQYQLPQKQRALSAVGAAPISVDASTAGSVPEAVQPAMSAPSAAGPPGNDSSIKTQAATDSVVGPQQQLGALQNATTAVAAITAQKQDLQHVTRQQSAAVDIARTSTEKPQVPTVLVSKATDLGEDANAQTEDAGTVTALTSPVAIAVPAIVASTASELAQAAVVSDTAPDAADALPVGPKATAAADSAQAPPRICYVVAAAANPFALAGSGSLRLADPLVGSTLNSNQFATAAGYAPAAAQVVQQQEWQPSQQQQQPEQLQPSQQHQQVSPDTQLNQLQVHHWQQQQEQQGLPSPSWGPPPPQQLAAAAAAVQSGVNSMPFSSGSASSALPAGLLAWQQQQKVPGKPESVASLVSGAGHSAVEAPAAQAASEAGTDMTLAPLQHDVSLAIWGNSRGSSTGGAARGSTSSRRTPTGADAVAMAALLQQQLLAAVGQEEEEGMDIKPLAPAAVAADAGTGTAPGAIVRLPRVSNVGAPSAASLRWSADGQDGDCLQDVPLDQQDVDGVMQLQHPQATAVAEAPSKVAAAALDSPRTHEPLQQQQPSVAQAVQNSAAQQQPVLQWVEQQQAAQQDCAGGATGAVSSASPAGSTLPALWAASANGDDGIAAIPVAFTVASKPLFADDDDGSAFFGSPAANTVAVPAALTASTMPAAAAAAAAAETPSTAALSSSANVGPAAQGTPDTAAPTATSAGRPEDAATAGTLTSQRQQPAGFTYAMASGPLFAADEDVSAFFGDDSPNVGQQVPGVPSDIISGGFDTNSIKEGSHGSLQGSGTAAAVAPAPWSGISTAAQAAATINAQVPAAAAVHLFVGQTVAAPFAATIQDDDDASAFFDDDKPATGLFGGAPHGVKQQPSPWHEQPQQLLQRYEQQPQESWQYQAGSVQRQVSHSCAINHQPDHQQQQQQSMQGYDNHQHHLEQQHNLSQQLGAAEHPSKASPVAASQTAQVFAVDDDASAFFDDFVEGNRAIAAQPANTPGFAAGVAFAETPADAPAACGDSRTSGAKPPAGLGSTMPAAGQNTPADPMLTMVPGAGAAAAAQPWLGGASTGVSSSGRHDNSNLLNGKIGGTSEQPQQQPAIMSQEVYNSQAGQQGWNAQHWRGQVQDQDASQYTWQQQQQQAYNDQQYLQQQQSVHYWSNTHQHWQQSQDTQQQYGQQQFEQHDYGQHQYQGQQPQWSQDAYQQQQHAWGQPGQLSDQQSYQQDNSSTYSTDAATNVSAAFAIGGLNQQQLQQVGGVYSRSSTAGGGSSLLPKAKSLIPAAGNHSAVTTVPQGAAAVNMLHVAPGSPGDPQKAATSSTLGPYGQYSTAAQAGQAVPAGTTAFHSQQYNSAAAAGTAYGPAGMQGSSQAQGAAGYGQMQTGYSQVPEYFSQSGFDSSAGKTAMPFGNPAAAAAASAGGMYLDETSLGAYAAAPPVNMFEGRRSPHGRPPCCFVTFGVAGQVILQQPELHSEEVEFSTMGAGVLHCLTIVQLPAALQTRCLGNGAGLQQKNSAIPLGTQSTSTGGAATVSIAATAKLLDAFPGPLGPQTNKDKCVKFITERLSQFVDEERLQDAPPWKTEGRRALWGLLLLMAKNQGQLKASTGNSSSGASKAAAAVGGLLKSAVGSGEAGKSAANTPTAAAAVNIAPANGAAGDSELLQILAPAAVSQAAAASSMQMLVAQVPEQTLQATAAEMQRLLLMGLHQDALAVAVAGQLWGPALVLAYGYGEKSFHEVAAAMAQQGLVKGTPLWTLSLLLARRPDLVHEGAPPSQQPSLKAATSLGAGVGADQLANGSKAPLRFMTAAPGIKPATSLGGLGFSPPGPRPAVAVDANPGDFNPPAVRAPDQQGLAGQSAAHTNGWPLTPNGNDGDRRGSYGGPTATVAAIGGGSAGFFTPTGGGPGGDLLLSQWRVNLAIMAANRTAADVEAIIRLGDRLLAEQGQLEAAHMCYMVAGYSTAPLDAAAAAAAPAVAPAATRLVLLGQDHVSTSGRRGLAQLLPIMKTELYEWARCLAGDSQHSWLPMLPYKLQLAALLADYGHIQHSLLYCSALDSVLRSVSSSGTSGSKAGAQPTQIPAAGIPPMLLVTAAQLESLRDRLTVHAAAHNIRIASNESALGKIASFLDRGLNKLMWGGEQAAVQPAAVAAQGLAAGRGTPVQTVVPSAAVAAGVSLGATAGGAIWLQQQQQQQQQGSPMAMGRNRSWTGMFGGGSSKAGSGLSSPAAMPLSIAADGAAVDGSFGVLLGPHANSATGAATPGQVGPRGASGTTAAGGVAGGFHGSLYPTATSPADGSAHVGPGGFVHHSHTGSQHSFVGGRWANQHLPAFSDAGSVAGHSRTPSYDFTGTAATGGVVAPSTAIQGAVGSEAPISSPATAATAANVGAVAVRQLAGSKSSHQYAQGQQQQEEQEQYAAISAVPARNQAVTTGSDGDNGSDATAGSTRGTATPPAATAFAAAANAEAGSSKAGGRGWLSGIGGLLGTKQSKEAKLGLENEFYYDEQRQRWVLRGQEDAAEPQQLVAPPPTSFGSAARPSGNSSTSAILQPTGPAGAGLQQEQGCSVFGASPVPPPPATAASSSSNSPPNFALRRPTGGVGSRYVQNSFASSKPPAAAVAGSNSNGPPRPFDPSNLPVGSSTSSSNLPGIPGGAGGSRLRNATPPPSGFFVPGNGATGAAAAADDNIAGDVAVDSADTATHTGATTSAASSNSLGGCARAAAGAEGLAMAAGPQTQAQQQQQEQQHKPVLYQQTGQQQQWPYTSAQHHQVGVHHSCTHSDSNVGTATLAPVVAPDVTYDAYFAPQQQQAVPASGHAGVAATAAAASSGYHNGPLQQQHGQPQQPQPTGSQEAGADGGSLSGDAGQHTAYTGIAADGLLNAVGGAGAAESYTGYGYSHAPAGVSTSSTAPDPAAVDRGVAVAYQQQQHYQQYHHHEQYQQYDAYGQNGYNAKHAGMIGSVSSPIGTAVNEGQLQEVEL